MRMIVQLRGGFSDQLWQYAYALYLQKRTQAEVWLDTSLLTESSATGYALGAYHLSLAVAPSWAVGEVLRGGGATARLRAWMGAPDALRVEGRDDVSPEGCMAAQRDIVLRGRFRYVEALHQVAATIRKDTDLNLTDLDEYHKKLLHRIREKNAVGLALFQPLKARIQACGTEKYVRSLEVALSDCGSAANPRLVFTDDELWVRNNVRFAHPVQYVPIKQVRNVCYEVHLMRCCRVFVPDGSALSWWASFLSEPNVRVQVASEFLGSEFQNNI